MYDKKIALIVFHDLLPWQKLNVAAFLSSSIALSFPEIHGRPFVNKTSSYLAFVKNPMLIYKAKSQEEMKKVLQRAKDRELAVAIYTKPLFATKNEEENLVEIAKYTDEEQELVGIALYGENKKIDKAIDGLRFHE